jgi:AbrB family looped-hinge helix DNA binding protein
MSYLSRAIPYFQETYTSTEAMKMSRVTAKFQIIIPPHVRSELGIAPGCEVDILKQGDRCVLVVYPLTGLKNSPDFFRPRITNPIL